jgi:addiction module HigA family antidote
MTQIKKNKDNDFKVEIGLNDAREWSDEKLARVKAFIKDESNKRTPERRLKNEILSIRYQMEEYLENNVIDSRHRLTLETFLNSYLKILNLTLRKFATSIDTTDANLKKYISGERKFNIDLAMKFAHFFHTTPDLWLKVQIKNELDKLNQERKQMKKYKKYDYEKVLAH